MELITAIINFLTEALHSKSAFVSFSFIILAFESMMLYALWVSHQNKSISLKRKELGMNQVDEAVEHAFKILNSHFLTLAKKKFGEDYFNKKETAIYRYLLTLALEDRKPVYRVRIRRNHFNEKSSAEWSKYVHDCINDDIQYITRYLDEHYHPQAVIKRPDLYAWNTDKVPELKEVLEDLFNQLLRIAEANQLKKFFGAKLDIGGI